MASSLVGGKGGSADCLPCTLLDGGGGGCGGVTTSGMGASPPPLSTIGNSPPASPDCPVNSGGGDTEFKGVTNTADRRGAPSLGGCFAAAAASAASSFFRAEASAFSASAFSRRAALSSSHFSRAFRSVASRRSAERSIRRVVADVSTDP